MSYRTVVPFLFLLSVSTASAQVPERINFQGRLTETGGLVNSNAVIEMELYSGSMGGTRLYAETQTVAVVDGLYTFELGNSNLTPGSLAAALSTTAYLQVIVNGQPLVPRERLSSAPYALSTRELLIDTNTPPNVVLAASQNTIFPGVISATVGATIGGGSDHSIESTANHSTIGGGKMNTISSLTSESTIAGGRANAIGINSPNATIGGGRSNTITNNGIYATIAGGQLNRIGANSRSATVGGGAENAIESFASYSTVGGGSLNTVSNSAALATIAGGRNNRIGPDGDFSTVGGGENNSVADRSQYATIAGGQFNLIETNTTRSTVGGGGFNTLAADSDYATLAGGRLNYIGTNADHAVVGGGRDNSVAEQSESATIGGGRDNTIASNASYTVVGGGTNNNVGANSASATIAGGDGNDIGANSPFAAVSGGVGNDVSFSSGGATIAGGLNNDISSSSPNTAVGGGWSNDIGRNSPYSVVPGGRENSVGDDAPYAFAAGRRAKANHPGTFVWADSIDGDFASTSNDQFLIRTSGGVGINDPNPEHELDVNGTTKADRFLAGAGSAGTVAMGFSADDNTGLFGPANNVLAFSTQGSERMRLHGGNLGIGTDAPAQRLHVVHNSTPVIIDRTGGDGALIRFHRDGSEIGNIWVTAGTVSYNNFTGSHAAWSEQAISRGMLVKLTGKNRRLHGDPESEIVYGVEPTRFVNESAVLGTFLCTTASGTPSSPSSPHLVMASGNGEVWVADTGRDIQPGDYLVSSHLPGHAMIDDRAAAQSHIVGRAGEGVIWSDVAESVSGTRHKRISILFQSFVRDNGTAGQRLAGLQAENKLLQERLARLEESMALFAVQDR